MSNLRWDPFGEDAECAMVGDIRIGAVGRLDVAPFTWWYSVEGISVKWMTRARGHVASKSGAKRAVARAWRMWAEKAGIA